MEQQHKNVILKHFTTLVKEMPSEIVAEHLRKAHVITTEMLESIRDENTRQAKARKLLDIILHKGTIHQFRIALLKAGKNNLKNLLNDESKTINEESLEVCSGNAGPLSSNGETEEGKHTNKDKDRLRKELWDLLWPSGATELIIQDSKSGRTPALRVKLAHEQKVIVENKINKACEMDIGYQNEEKIQLLEEVREEVQQKWLDIQIEGLQMELRRQMEESMVQYEDDEDEDGQQNLQTEEQENQTENAQEDQQCINECMLDIGEGVYVVANAFQRGIIHIRTFEKNIAGKLYPTKKGVILSHSAWLGLESCAEFTVAAMGQEEETKHLGGTVYLATSDKYPRVDIRHYWQPIDVDEPVRTKRGVLLNAKQFDKLRDVMNIIRDFVPDLKGAIPCSMSVDHQNQLGMLRCGECNPFHCSEY